MTTRGWAGQLPIPRLRGWAGCLATLVFLVSDPPAAVAGPECKRVVVIYPHESDGAPGIIQVNRTIRSTFASRLPEQIEVRNEYVDATRLGDADFMRAQVMLLRRKYAAQPADLVIAGLSSGLDFALAIRDEVFPGVPIVSVLVEQRELMARRLPPGVTGAPIRMDLTGTLELAFRLHPDTRRVFVIAGCSPFDKRWEAEARRVFRPYEGRAEFIYLSGLPMDDLLARVADLPERSVIYYLHVFTDGTGKGFVPAEVLECLAGRANAPIYSHVDTFIDRGAIGGHVYTHEVEAAIAARLGLRILSGEKPETIAIPEESESTYLFNWRQLRRWGIGEESLPPGSVVRYKEPTFWGTYKWHVVAGVALCLAEAALIAALVIQLVKRRRADALTRQVIETSPIGMLLVNRDGTLVIVNAQIERLFGYTRNELIGRPVELLIPGRMWGAHPDAREQFFAAPRERPTECGGDLLGCRKDGSKFPVEVRVSPLRTPRGLFALASVADLAARRRAEDELRTSQQELRVLAGWLLEAQEAERRRVARELHDDVNQSLALLAVEMDLLAAAPPGSPAQTADRARELAARLKETSSSVHNLSHQLHPSKLEHLGLVAAVRSLCKELSHAHGLDVKVTHCPDPGAIPRDVALCLYRIVQEALRNVVRHSGSGYASVELTGTGDAVRLRVADDGCGFDPGTVEAGLGLVSMRERLNLVGGTIVIDSRPSGGTRIDVRVPLPVVGGLASAAPASVGSDP